MDRIDQRNDRIAARFAIVAPYSQPAQAAGIPGSNLNRPVSIQR